MVFTYFDITYGTIVQWDHLKNTSLVTPEMKDLSLKKFITEFNLKNKFDLDVVAFDAHDAIELYMKDKPSRLPKTYLANPTHEYEAESDLVCIGIQMGCIVVGHTNRSDYHPDFDEMMTDKMKFDTRIPKDVLAIGGQPDIHYIPDDCGCCS